MRNTEKTLPDEKLRMKRKGNQYSSPYKKKKKPGDDRPSNTECMGNCGEILTRGEVRLGHHFCKNCQRQRVRNGSGMATHQLA